MIFRNVAVVKRDTIGRLSIENTKGVEKWRATQHDLHLHLGRVMIDEDTKLDTP